MSAKPVLALDGEAIRDRASFYNEVSRVVLGGNHDWGKNLDAFNDILQGGFGSPPGGFVIAWENHEKSKAALGQTLFDTIIDIIRDHGPNGEEHEDGVDLRLG